MHDPTHILVVDDHADIRDPLAAYLRRYGMQVSTAANGEEMRTQLAARRTDLIILDVMMPGEDGLTLCRYVYEHLGIPVILLTAVADSADRIVGLEMGADDYIVKPFEPRELLARIRVILRRVQEPRSRRSREQAYTFEQWCLNASRHELQAADGDKVELSPAEFRLLLAFVEHPNRVLSRDKLLELIDRDQDQVFDRSVDSHISRLRKKLGDDSRQLLRTAWGNGYLFAAVVEQRYL